MIKNDIVNAIAEDVGCNKTVAKAAVDSLIDNIEEALMCGEEVKFAGFGTFKLKHRSYRIGRNPHNGQKVIIPERTIVVFKPGSELKNIGKYHSMPWQLD